ncbi:MAG: guanylate kinase [Thermoguttaceae bacterium]
MAGARCGRVVVISGPSGVGKTTLVDRLLQTCSLPLVRSISATTRLPRGEELDGVDYHFVGPERFQALRDEGEFLECFEVFGRGYWYGTLSSEVRAGIQAGKWVVLNIDVHGAAAVMERFAGAITIFVCPSSMGELRRRLQYRGTDTPEEIEKRLQRAQYELSQAHLYRYQVINDNLDRAVNEMCTILTEEKENERND